MTLHYDILKNFTELKKIRQNTNIPLKLIPNDIYIKDCPWQKGHIRMQGSHRRNKYISTPYFSYYRNKCVNLRHHKPDEIFKAMWIAPSQLKQYKFIGYNNFKLLDRLADTEWIPRTIQAYLTEKSLNNLETILGTYGRHHSEKELAELTRDDTLDPIDKLEFIPQIRSNDLEVGSVFKFWESEKHSQNCGTCQLCNYMFEKTTIFSQKNREIAKERNRDWQNMITKLEFIEKLSNGFVQRVKYE